MKRRVLILFIYLLVTQILHAQNRQLEFKQYFSALRNNQQFNGNVLVAENGRIVYEQSFGYSDFINKTRNTKNTEFPIASLSKTFTATAILQLVQSGKLGINDPVVNYLTEFPYPTITIAQLLSHTSGLPPYNAYFDSVREVRPSQVFTNADFINGLVRRPKPLLYSPGEKGNYDNINFIVLALVLEKVSRMKYEDYIKRYILEPAGMRSTIFFPLKQQYAQTSNSRFAFPHLGPHLYSDTLVKASSVPYVAGYWHSYNFTGFGDYVSTTHDLLKFDAAYYSGKLLTDATLNEAFTPVALTNGTNNPGNFGLGWEVEQDSALGKVIYHSGAATGLSCVLLRNITRHQTIIVFDNIHYNAQEIASNAMKLLNGVQVSYPKKSVAKIYARVLLHGGASAARDTLYRLKTDTSHYLVSEDEMNSLGYDFMGGTNNPNPFRFPEDHKYQEAVETFKLNMELFPASWNVYDSYGEALLTIGEKEEAIRMYQKSIELNPKNQAGKRALEQLLKK